MKKTIISTILLALFFLPSFSFAATCSPNGSSVVYINGIFTSEASAKRDLDLFKKKFESAGLSDVYFLNGYNESHIAGLGDIIKVLSQMQKGASLDYDLTNILRQVSEELSTRKVLLVGHSQGTFYTNEAYRYLIWSGVPSESIAVYNIATPADFVAGGGRYLTSETDKVIRSVATDLAYQGFAKMPLPPNIYIPLNRKEFSDKYGGHSLSGVYLKNVPDRIVGDMKKALDNLFVPFFNFNQPPDGDCFFAPKISLSHRLKTFNFTVMDKVGWGIGRAAGATVKVATTASDLALNAAYKIYKVGEYFVLEILRMIKENPEILMATIQTNPDKLLNIPAENPPPQNQISPTEDKNLVRSDLTKFAGTGGPTQDSVQDQIDDILEKIDILQRKIADIKAAENPTEPTDAQPLSNLDDGDENGEQDNNNQNNSQNNNQNNSQNNDNQNTNAVSNSVGGGRAVYYGKILISEVQVGGVSDSKEEFVELYNMEAKEIDLTDWYLQRKTKTGSSYSSFAPKPLFSSKKIAAHGYFLIARTDYFSGLGDIFTDNPLTDDNTLALKNPVGEISDKVGWGQAQDYELIATQNPSAISGQTIGRKIVSDEPQDTDVNLMDFEFGNSTPKAKNTAYTPPPAPPLPPEPKDTTAPQVVFNIAAIQEQLSFAVDFEITDPLGTISPSGVASYVFRWKPARIATQSVAGEEESGGWNEDATQQVNGNPYSASLKKDFSGLDEKSYYFQIKAKDAEGNESDWQPEIPAETKISVFKKVLINEIQIDGKTGTGGTNDDWVELYNPNDVAVSLNDWSIQKHSSANPCSSEVAFKRINFSDDAIILAKEYFLIVRNTANQELLSIANMTSSYLQLSGDNTVYLVKSRDEIESGEDADIIDKVGFGEKSCFPEANFAPSPPEEKSIERKIIGGDTDNNSADFRVSGIPTPRASFMQIGIKDATNYDPNFGSNNGANFYQLTIEWSSKTSDISFYQVQHKINNEDWENWLENTTDTKGYFIAYYSALLVENTHSFRARTQDTNGNQSDWAQIDIDLSAPVVVNEFALFGTNADRGDIWVELYNKSDKAVDLTGWYWKSNDSRVPLSGIIPANGYFVLEKKNDNSISDLAANQVFAETLTATGLAGLFGNNGRAMDYLPMPSGGWQEYHFKQGENFYSVERISPYAEGMYSQNWRINNGLTINGADRNGSPILGTPGGQNSNHQIYTVLSAGFGGKAVLPKNLSPYLAVDYVKVLESADVTIEPGSMIKFYSATSSFWIDGTLTAKGSDAEKIVFTSFKDDEYSGDTNGDSNASSPSPGNWLGLHFTKTSKNSELENIIVRYGGATIGFSPPGWGHAVWAENSVISLKNSLLEKNQNRALALDNSDSVVDSVKFLNNDTTNYDTDATQSRAIYIKGGRPSVKNSYFEKNYIGIYITSFYDEVARTTTESLAEIENNKFINNIEPIFWAGLARPSFSGNIAEGNTYNAIIFFADISRDITLKPDLQYLVKYERVVQENITLTIEPGVVMAFTSSSASLRINGALKAIGTPDRPITFGRYRRDDERLSPGIWGGLRFTKTSKNSELENVEISYGGSPRESQSAGVKVDQSVISLKNSTIKQNANNGVWLVNSPSVIDSVQFLEHKEKTSSADARAIFVEGGMPEIRNSFFKDNYYGIYIDNWLNEETGENIFGTPILEKNQFEGSIEADIYMLPSLF